MSNYSDLEVRMRGYEDVANYTLTRRMPVIIRVDGKSFHTFTRNFNRPFDDLFRTAMQHTMKRLCENIQGCVFGYTDSDEISLVLIDYKTLNSDCWFGNRVQKMASLAAAMATLYFNKEFEALFHQMWEDGEIGGLEVGVYDRAIERGATFDARVFNLPREEVTNYFYCRQRNAERNSIQAYGQVWYSHKELLGKSCNEIQDMMMTEHDFNWNNLPIDKKRGTCCYRRIESNNNAGIIYGKGKWYIDEHMPRLVNDGRDLVEDLIAFPEERKANYVSAAQRQIDIALAEMLKDSI